MATTHSTGGEIDAFCNKCKMMLAHTILAMVGTKVARVRCNTCMGEHVYRGSQPNANTAKTPRAPKAPKKESAPKKVVIGFEEQLAGKDVANARAYNVKDTFKVDEVIKHPTFGIGIVTAVRPDKVDVNFKMDQKVLVHGRGGPPADRPQFAKPKTQVARAADKPMAEGEELPPADAGEGEENAEAAPETDNA